MKSTLSTSTPDFTSTTKITDTPLKPINHPKTSLFAASIQRVTNVLKKFLGLPSQHQHESIEIKNKNIDVLNYKKLSDSDQENALPLLNTKPRLN